MKKAQNREEKTKKLYNMNPFVRFFWRADPHDYFKNRVQPAAVSGTYCEHEGDQHYRNPYNHRVPFWILFQSGISYDIAPHVSDWRKRIRWRNYRRVCSPSKRTESHRAAGADCRRFPNENCFHDLYERSMEAMESEDFTRPERYVWLIGCCFSDWHHSW